MKKFLPLIFILAALVSCGSKKNETPENIEDIPEIEDISDTENIPEITSEAGEAATTEIPETEITSKSVTTVKSGSAETTKAKTGKNSGNTKTEKNDSKSKNEISEPVEFREYYPEDFTEITVQLTKQDGEPPIEFSEIDYSWFDTDEKLSPCKSDTEIVEANIATMEQSYLEWGRENVEELIESYRIRLYESLETPRKGRIMDYTYGDGKAYFLVNYDELCGDYMPSHCIEIVKCDLESQTSEVIFSHDSLDNPIDLWRIFFNGGDVWAITYQPMTYHQHEDELKKPALYKVNTKKKSLEKAAGIPDEIDYTAPLENDDGRLLIIGNIYTDSEFNQCVYEYDRKAKKFQEIYRTSDDRHFAKYGQGCVVAQENIDNATSAVCDKFRLNTGIKGAKLEAVSDNRISFISDTLTGTTLYTYDLQKMERYEIDISHFGTSADAIGDNLILTGSMGHTYTFLIPDIGAAFVMLSFENSTELKNSDGSLYIIGNPENNEQYNFVGDFVGNYDEEKKVYTFSE